MKQVTLTVLGCHSNYRRYGKYKLSFPYKNWHQTLKRIHKNGGRIIAVTTKSDNYQPQLTQAKVPSQGVLSQLTENKETQSRNGLTQSSNSYRSEEKTQVKPEVFHWFTWLKSEYLEEQEIARENLVKIGKEIIDDLVPTCLIGQSDQVMIRGLEVLEAIAKNCLENSAQISQDHPSALVVLEQTLQHSNPPVQFATVRTLAQFGANGLAILNNNLAVAALPLKLAILSEKLLSQELSETALMANLSDVLD